MMRRSLRHAITASLLLVALVSQGTWALAGTTGGLSGTVIDASTSAPIAGAKVTVSSPSQVSTTTTDAGGHFNFLTLPPDTYTVSVVKEGYQEISVPGQIVFADTNQTVTIRLSKALKTIARVAAVAPGALVKSGTTADLYSVNAATQQSVAALGGGGSLNQAYSAIATIPGAYVVPNQTGYYETINIRGGDYDQVGYEFDGVPVTRSFDNYGSSSANALGQAEVEVYNGAVPADSEGQGLSGYVNQVIKTGTYPGYADTSLGIGTPVYYHRAAVEAGGATPDRLFSYYLGVGGSNQSYDYVNTNNGTEYAPNFGVVSNLIGFAPGCGVPATASLCANNAKYAPQCLLGSVACFGPQELAMGPLQYGNFSTIFARDVVANFHFGIPHHNDAGRDDIQVLYDNESLQNQLYESPNDFASPQCGSLGGAACATFLYGPQVYPNSLTWSCPSAIGHAVTASAASCVTTYAFPNAPAPGTATSPNDVPTNVRDSSYNQTVIGKVQYTKNFGSSAFLRVYGYTYFSAWTLAGVLGDLDCNFACTVSPDYELYTHTRGLSANFQDQINAQNLISLQGNYTTATITRDNNYFFKVPGEMFAPIVSTANPYSGYCYGGTPVGGALPVVNCAHAFESITSSATTYGGLTIGQVGTGASLAGLTCGGHPCEYMVAENGLNGEITPNLVPNFYGWSLQDQFRPTDKWLFVPGIRLDTFAFAGGNELVPPLGPNTANVAAVRQFWWNAFNLDNCQNTTTGAVFANPSPGKLCPKGSIATYMQNQTNQNFAFNIWQPRLAGTYTADPDNVIRFSAGRYTEAANTAFEQYGTRQIDSADFIGPTFLQYSRNTPGYPVQPQASLNYDLSWEHQFKGTDLSFKLTPFLRQTQNQIQEFFLNAKEGFVSGLNAGNQRSQGVEFQLQKGDFSRNGFSGLFSFAYTNSYIKYQPVNQFGGTVLTGVNTQIQQYNAYTAACAKNPSNPLCGSTSNGMTANACYTSSGTPVAPVATHGTSVTCPAGDIVNPYWFAAPQSPLSTTALYPTYDIFPGSTAFPGAYAAFGAPFVSTLVLNYKQNKLVLTPSLQFQGGAKYGYPLSSVGIDPAAGFKPLGGAYGQRYDASSCDFTVRPCVINIPDPYTNQFDNLGSFTQPNEFMLNMQVSYDVSPRIQLVGTMANIVNYCWGGTKAPWTLNDGNVCSYENPTSLLDPVAPYGTPGAYINPPGVKQGAYIVQRAQQYPYFPSFGPFLAAALNSSTKTPFQFYVTANIKI